MNRTVHLIVNPFGGTQDNRALAHQALSTLNGLGIKVNVDFTECKGHAMKLACSLSYAPEKTICGLGGDGTMHEIINGIMCRPSEEKMHVALLPGGTGNSFLEDVGVFKFNDALRMIIRGNYKNIDLLKIQLDDSYHFAFNVCGWGMFASANAAAESLRCIKKIRYHAAGLWEIIRNRSQQAKLTFDSQTIEGDFSLIVASNTRNVGKSMMLSPSAKFDDGKLDLTFLKQSGRWALMRLFQKLPKGNHIHEPGISCIQCREFEIVALKTTLWNLDGEIYSGKRAKVTVLPHALSVCI